MSDDLVKRAAFALSDMQGRIDAGKLKMFQDCIDRIEELEANINTKADFIDATINQLEAAEQRGYASAMEAERKLHEDRIEELEAKLAELLAVSKRAVRLSLDHSDFKLYAMEPMHQAITAAELKGQNDG